MDDVLIWVSSQEEHDTRVWAVLEKAQKAGNTFNTVKCEFSKREVSRSYNFCKWDGNGISSCTTPNKELKISADVSSYGLRAVMLRKHKQVWSPVARGFVISYWVYTSSLAQTTSH